MEVFKNRIMANRKFTYVEIILIISTLLIVAGFLLTRNKSGTSKLSQGTVCFENRRLLESAEEAYYTECWKHTEDMFDLVQEGYLKKVPKCPSGGEYSWMKVAEDNPLYQSVILCSVHRTLGETEDTAVLDEIYDVDIPSLETGWYQFRSKTGVHVDALSEKSNITDIIILNDEGKWETHTRKEGKFETLKTIPRETNFWIQVEKEEKKMLLGII